MIDRFQNLVMIGFHKYAEFATALGKSYLGTQLIINGRIVGARSKKHCYVDPATYKAVFGKRPFGSIPEYFDKKRNTLNGPDLSKSIDSSVKCPKCKSSMNPGKEEDNYKYICSRCRNKY